VKILRRDEGKETARPANDELDKRRDNTPKEGVLEAVAKTSTVLVLLES
jgi:hypothetical protein